MKKFVVSWRCGNATLDQDSKIGSAIVKLRNKLLPCPHKEIDLKIKLLNEDCRSMSRQLDQDHEAGAEEFFGKLQEDEITRFISDKVQIEASPWKDNEFD